MKQYICQGVTVEYEDDIPVNPIRGVNKTSIDPQTPIPYRRKSSLDDIPDNYSERIMKLKGGGKVKEMREVRIPDGFCIAPAYNKGAYQVVPQNDTDAYTKRK
tara:strand:+ start:113 stop:421 length:309 start_codon:yes stop_codon:yes gene_type:complete